MDLLQYVNILPKDRNKLNWAEANGLWAIARNKLIGLSTLEVYIDQAQDKELKMLVELGTTKNAVPHIKMIVKLLHEEGLDVPSMLGRSSLENIGKNTGEKNFFKDHEIAVSLREVIRLSLFITFRAIESAVRSDVMDLAFKVFRDDFIGFRQLIDLQTRKNWLMSSPGVGTQNINARERLNWGEACGLWSIARDKLIKLNLYEIYLSQVVDAELKKALESAAKKTVIPHIKKINLMLHEEEFEIPSMFGRTSLDLNVRDTGDLYFLKDYDIAVNMREHLRTVLFLDFEAIMDSVRSDAMDLLWDIFSEDLQGLRDIIEIQKKKNWLLSPPAVGPEHKAQR
ncbi:DUF3231 family protein [Pelotomaculum propionicicum]|uniref:DUF3231 family protein n=1 Tax=Pelotomaculum propionicicum TaxID=258475 RepID=UPI003B801C87